MSFYAVLTFYIAPLVGLKYMGGKDGVLNGIMWGSLISILLWNFYGAQLLELK